MFPPFLPSFGLDGVRKQMDRVRQLWELRRLAGAVRVGEKLALEGRAQLSPRSQNGNLRLGALVVGKTPSLHFA
jgi:hypothetical protein